MLNGMKYSESNMQKDEIPIGQCKDLRGQRFGDVIVLYRIKNEYSTGTKWRCQCDCGNFVDFTSRSLHYNKNLNCGCKKKKYQKVKIGEKYGFLTVIEKTNKRRQSDGSILYKCKCDCGNIVELAQDGLLRGTNQSCGINCIFFAKKRELHRINEIGNKYGLLTVIKDSGKRTEDKGEILWLCQCECGNTKLVKGSHLRSNHIISCGCLSMSKGELKIKQLLDNLHIIYQQEYQLSNKQRFDFYLPNYNLAIEYDGKQHFEEWTLGNNTLQERQKQDNIKNQYCKENNIYLIRIPYTDYDILNKEYIMERLNNLDKYNFNG